MLITLRLHLLRALNSRFQQLHCYCSTRFKFLLRSLNPRFLQLQRSPDRYSSTRFSNHFLRAFDPSSAGLASLSTWRSRPQLSRLLKITLLRARNTDNSQFLNTSTLFATGRRTRIDQAYLLKPWTRPGNNLIGRLYPVYKRVKNPP